MTIVLRCPLYEHSKQPVQPPYFLLLSFLETEPSSTFSAEFMLLLCLSNPQRTSYSVRSTLSLPSFAHVRIPRDSSPFEHRFSYWRKGLTINIWAINIESTPYAHRTKLLCLCRHHPGCIITPQSPWVAGVGPMYVYKFSLFQKT